MDFWVFEIKFFDAWIAIGVMTVVFLLANVLRRKVGIIRKSLLPTAVLAGLIMLILKALGLYDWLNLDRNEVNTFFEALTYHALALGVIALTLKSTKKEKARNRQIEIFNSGLITVNTYLLQGIIGAGVTLLLATTFMKNLFPASGLLLPLGYGQGTGQAVNFGHMYEVKHGFFGGTSFGLTIATVGFLIACLVGVGHIVLMRRRGKIKEVEKNEFVTTEIVASPNEVPVTEAIDRMTIQIVLMLLVYFLTFLFMFGIEQLPLGKFGEESVKPLIWGFNFLIGSLLAALLKIVFRGLKKINLMTRDYPNNYLLNRISGFCFDIMIVAGTSAIEMSVLKELILPLVIICFVGAVLTYFYVRKLSYTLFPDYQDEAFLSLFGMLTGTTSTGMILLREVDPRFETPAANNLIYQAFYAIALGFPLFLLLGIAPKGTKHTFFSLLVLVAMFIVFNILLFRRQLFGKKRKA